MLDHVGFAVSGFDRSLAFYRAALAPLGISVLMEFPGEGNTRHAGLGTPGKPFFWIGDAKKPDSGVHLAFSAPDRDAVRRFYDAALTAGGRDNGGPGLRAEYHPTYYAAFVLDPDGNNVEAVCHAPE